MSKSKRTSGSRISGASNPFRVVSADEDAKSKKSDTHIYGRGHRCDTDTRGFPTPRNRGPVGLVVDASEGFIPLWRKNVTLRWRFNEKSLKHFTDIKAAKDEIRNLLGQALLLWGDAVPVKFSERTDAWDFEIVVEQKNDCDASGCVLASAFFPDQGRHRLYIYPMTFDEPKKEQIDTLAHELGHVFGLRHFFAQLSEKAWPSRIFGKHKPFSIMNYGAKSAMTSQDRQDLKSLYAKAWSRELKEINGTKIKLVKPFHMT